MAQWVGCVPGIYMVQLPTLPNPGEVAYACHSSQGDQKFNVIFLGYTVNLTTVHISGYLKNKQTNKTLKTYLGDNRVAHYSMSCSKPS